MGRSDSLYAFKLPPFSVVHSTTAITGMCVHCRKRQVLPSLLSRGAYRVSQVPVVSILYHAVDSDPEGAICLSP